ncbi:MAG TPA: ROK family protein, partial [Acidimicrobiia bacterium]|nr:ROK family protein [Acidimicrobiia bacterium]
MSGAGAAPTLGVDLGGTNLRVGVVDADGRLLAEERIPCPTTGWPAVVSGITALARRLCDPYGARALGLGVAALV